MTPFARYILHNIKNRIGVIVCVYLSLGICGLDQHNTQPLDWASINPQEPSQTDCFHLARGNPEVGADFFSAILPNKALVGLLPYMKGTGLVRFPFPPRRNPIASRGLPLPCISIQTPIIRSLERDYARFDLPPLHLSESFPPST